MARQRFPDVRFLVFGREAEVQPLIDSYDGLSGCCEIVHTDDVVSSDEKPSSALRNGRSSSMRLAINSVKEGRAQAVVSAGNTGALMGMAKFVLKTLPGIDRPAIASFLPTLKGESVMLDLGANVQCDSSNLVDFAIMGAVFSRLALGRLEPTIGILNVGSEDRKGHEALWDAATVLRGSEGLPGAFHGFVEGDDIAKGTVDVIVTDGFTGNVALKTAEGTAKLVSEYLRQSFRSSLFASLGYLLARASMRKLRHRLDPRRYNGAVFLGLNGITVKSHGGTDALGFANAIGLAVDLVRENFISRIQEDYANLDRGSLNGDAAEAV